jgi:large subunit ribosomal protein L4
MSAPAAPLLDASGASTKDVALDAAVFAAEVKPHLVHEAVRAEFNERRQGTRGAKNRALVSGGRAKPWRQKGTGRSRQGTIRAPQFKGGGVAFPTGGRSYTVKVNRKAARAALRSALSDHVGGQTLALIAGRSFDEPSTRTADQVLRAWGQERPTLLVATEAEENVIRSFRNLEQVLVSVPAELEVAEVVWARSLLVTEDALPLVQGRAGR